MVGCCSAAAASGGRQPCLRLGAGGPHLPRGAGCGQAGAGRGEGDEQPGFLGQPGDELHLPDHHRSAWGGVVAKLGDNPHGDLVRGRDCLLRGWDKVAREGILLQSLIPELLYRVKLNHSFKQITFNKI